MAGRPLTDEYDIQRANMHIGEQNKLMRSLEEQPFMDPVNFADDVFVKGMGTSLYFISADKAEILERFGLKPEEEFSQDIVMTGMVDGKRNYEVGKVMFERHELQDFKTPTMETETVDITHIQGDDANHIGTVVVTEHALGDVVFTEVRIADAKMPPQELKANLETLHTMLSDARDGTVTYDMDAKEVTKFDMFGGDGPSAGQG
ncbi:MAG: hypothetical protein JKY71_05635 [Alphaproteobacteria bacterium]|nr:hypothetical protein [Alphaproteobacteria bacterium]